ncbi:WXG100 family type VII secretion target [Streptomyces sp. NPDC007903]|uniref:WXG100 family type VII secretion target n=1 Tax=Streptomyces sp. NPDC007903 TaxID=3364786 RepID=UPI0036E4C35D
MSEHDGPSEPKLSTTDFESMTHEQLAAMLDSASPASAAHLSSKLADAASTISEIGNDLMKYVKDLEWQGHAGDAFRDWGGQTASSTLRLGLYAQSASAFMSTVTQAIGEAKAAMPDTSESTQARAALATAHKTINAAKQPGARNDPDARKAAQTAQTDAAGAEHRLESTRQAAIQQMRKLAQSYEYAATQVNSVPPPTFAPPAGRAAPEEWWHTDGKEYVPGSTTYSSGERTSASTHASTQRIHSVGTPVSHRVTVAPVIDAVDRPSHHLVSHPEPVSLGIDSVDTAPRTQTSPATVTGPTMPNREVSLPGLPVGVPQTFGSGRGINSALTPRLPGVSRLPQVPGLVNSSGSMPRMPREAGIMGGRPVASAGRPVTGIPRGTVIGNENAQGRTPMGRTMSPGSPAGDAARSTGALGQGRRLASETGGVVGGRTQPGRTGGRPFTSGGSGLVRPSAKAPHEGSTSQAGRTSASGRPANSRKSGEGAERRPDYLLEDEETWTRKDRQSLPPVVD